MPRHVGPRDRARPSRPLGALALALATTLALGCGAPPPAPDAGPDPDTGGVTWDGALEVGTGRDAFAPIAPGDTLLLARGCQGSQHVWIRLRARTLDPRGMAVRLGMTRARDGAPVTLEFYVRLSFEPAPGGDFAELGMLTLQVPVPDEAIGEPLTLWAEVVDRARRGARDERRDVRVAWGTEVCGGDADGGGFDVGDASAGDADVAVADGGVPLDAPAAAP